MKQELKHEAIKLRKNGLTYTEILKLVPVAKSTLSLWLRSVSLSRRQRQTLTAKKLASQRRGGEARKRERIQRTSKILSTSIAEIDKISEKELWLMGTMLYWAEGAKEKIWRTGCSMKFDNSDPRMIKLFIIWMKVCLKIRDDDFNACIYIHENWKDRQSEIRSFWAKVTGLGYNNLDKIYFKHNRLSTKRKNVGKEYHGLLRVTIKRSIDLNRRIAGWIEGICLKTDHLFGN